MTDKRDNRTEQWLEEYASHRRARHGSEPKMHDATRRLLHGEVQRTWGRPSSAEEVAGGWGAGLFKYATGVIALGALALGLWMTTDRTKDTDGTMTMTQIDPAKIADKSGASGEQSATEDLLNIHRGEKAPVVAQANKAGIHKAFAKDSLPQRDFLHNMRRNFSQQVQNNNLAKPKAAPVPVPGQAVMEDFEVIRNGKTVQVRDGDGSIYTGRVILASATMPMVAGIPGQGGGGGGLPPGGGGGLPPGGGGGPLPHDQEKLRKFSAPVTAKKAARSLGAPQVPPGKGLRPVRKTAVNPVQREVYNDNFSRSLPVALNKTTIGHNVHATPEPLENGFLNFHGRSVWYSFEIKPSDFESREYGMVTISTRGSNFDTTLGIFVADKNNGLVIPSGSPSEFWDDNQPNVPWSEVKIPIAGPKLQHNINAIPGQGGGGLPGGGGGPNKPQPPESPLKYYVAVDGVNGVTGQIRLNVRWATSIKDVKEAKRRLIAHHANTYFYFQVAGTNRTSGKPVKFEGFMRNASVKTKERVRPKDSPEGFGSSATVAPLRIQGRASYGGKRLTVDAFTAALTPASALKSERQSK